MACQRMCRLLLAAATLLSVIHGTEGFGLGMTMRPSISSSDNLGSSSRLPRSSSNNNNNHNGKFVRLPSTANEAVAVGISSSGGGGGDAAFETPSAGLRSRIYDGIKKRIIDRKNQQQQQKKERVQDISDVHEFQSMIATEREALIAVLFHAPYCKACQASMPLFHRMARKYSNKNVTFVSVRMSEFNKEKLRGMGVQKFPFGHIYDPERGLVDELPMLRKQVSKFEEQLRSRVKAQKKTNQGKK